MFGLARSILVLGALLGTVCLAAPAQAYVVGSTLRGTPDAEVCAFESTAPTVHACTTTQDWLAYGRVSPAGLTSPITGLVTGWSVSVGEATPATVSLRAQPRTMSLSAGGATGVLVDLPLPGAGTSSGYFFGEHMPIRPNERVGLTIYTGSDGTGPAGAPIAAQAPELGVTAFWEGARPEGESGIWESQPDTELLFQAQIEPDLDRDGLGDETQDTCPTTNGPQTCPVPDRIAPNFVASYESRQEFLRSGRIALHMRSDERGTVSAGGMLRVTGGGGSFYPLRAATRTSKPNRSVRLAVRVPRRARRAAFRALRKQGKATAQLRVAAYDLAGNEGSMRLTVSARGKPRASS